MNLAAKDLKFQKPLKMSSKSRILCVSIVAWQGGGDNWGRVEFESHHRSSDFDQWIRDGKDLCQNVAENLSQDKKHIRRAKCVNFLKSIDNEMAHFNISTTKKSKNQQVKYQKHADLFLIAWKLSRVNLNLKAKRLINIFTREFFEKLRTRVSRVRPNIKNNWVLPHENVPCHTALSVNRFMSMKNISVSPQPPHSRNLSSCGFFPILRLQNHLNWHYFGTLENIHKVVTDQPNTIPISEFHHCHVEWKKRLQSFVASEVTLKETIFDSIWIESEKCN